MSKKPARVDLPPGMLAATSRETSTYAINGVGVARLNDKQAIAAATDGRCLAIQIVDADLPAEAKDAFVVPTSVVKAKKGQLAVLSLTQHGWSNESQGLMSKAVEGSFPNILKVLPDLPKIPKATDAPTSPVLIAVNARLLLNLATAMGDDVVQLLIRDPRKPFLAVSKENPNACGVMMPYALDDDFGAIYSRVRGAAVAAWNSEPWKDAPTPAAPAAAPARPMQKPGDPPLSDEELWARAQPTHARGFLGEYDDRNLRDAAEIDGAQSDNAPFKARVATDRKLLDAWWAKSGKAGWAASSLEFDEMCEFQLTLDDGTPVIAVYNPGSLRGCPHVELHGAISGTGYCSMFYDDSWPQGLSLSDTVKALAQVKRTELLGTREGKGKGRKPGKPAKAVRPAPAPKPVAPPVARKTSKSALAQVNKLAEMMAA